MQELLHRFWRDLIDRVGGPMSFRLVLQPAMAAFLAIRAGIQDARARRPAFLFAFITDPLHRRRLFREMCRTLARVFVFGLVMDAIYQLVVLHAIRPLEAVTTAVVLVVIPYMLLRGPVRRVARRVVERAGGEGTK